MWIVALLFVMGGQGCVSKKVSPLGNGIPTTDGTTSPDGGKNRPDTTGVPPKTDYILGAKFYNSEVSGVLDLGSSPASPSSQKISIPDFAMQACSFMNLLGRSSFRWSFSKDTSSSAMPQEFDVSVSMSGLPEVGRNITIQGLSASGSVSLIMPNLIDGVFGFWRLSPLSSDTSCVLTTLRVLKADGSPAPTDFTGPFRVDSSIGCKLQSFGSQSSQYLTFNAALGCTGTVTSSSTSGTTGLNKWFIESGNGNPQSLVFELQNQKMAISIAQTFCSNKSFGYRLPTQPELQAAVADIKSNFFADSVNIPGIWATPDGQTATAGIVTNLDQGTPVMTKATDMTTANVICVY